MDLRLALDAARPGALRLTSRRVRGIALGAALVAPVCAHAQSAGGPPTAPLHRLEAVVVTASREPTPLERSPGTVTVITREQIERSRYTSVADLLRHVPGVHLEAPGSRGSRASLYTRGLDPNQTLVLIDGVRMNDPINNRGGSFDLSTLDPAGIERIEIVRGPLSAVHGSDAIAGAVQVITRDGRGGRGLDLDASGGRFGVYRVAGDVRGGAGGADLSLAGAWVDEGSPPDGQRFRGGNLKTVAALQLPGDASLSGTLRFAGSESRAFPDDSGGPDFAVFRQLEQRDVHEVDLGVELAQASGRWLDYAIGGSYHRRREDRSGPGIAPGVRDPFGVPSEASRDRLDTWALSLRNSFRLAEHLSATAGGDVYREQGSSEGELFPGQPGAIPTSFALHRVVGGAFGELMWTCDCGLSLYGGLRADLPEDASWQLTPRVSVRYRVPRAEVIASGSYGRGFKLPSFFALESPLVGNPALVPERSQGFDVSLSRAFLGDRLWSRLTWFRLEVRNLIDFEPGPPPRLVNRDEVVSQGFELELRAQPLPSLELAGNLGYTRAEIVGTSTQMLQRPRWQGNLSAIWSPLEAVTLRVEALFVGAVRDSSVPTGPRVLAPWVRVDLSTFWRLRDHLALYLEVDNLLDADYEEAIGFPAPGIRPRIGLEWRL